MIELLIEAFERELPTLAGHRFVQQPEALRGNDGADMNQKLFGFLDQFMLADALWC
ncbi:MAG: hypothetical protein QM617_05395 [Comamonas sp.]